MTQKLKICMVTTFYPPFNFGGDGMWVYRLTNALAAEGHKIDVVFNPHAYQMMGGDHASVTHPNHPNVTLKPLVNQQWGIVGVLAEHQLGKPVANKVELETHFKNHAYDVIHFHNISLMGGPDVLHLGDAVKLCTLNDHWFVCAMHVLWRYNREACGKRTCLACTLRGKRPPQIWRYTDKLAKAVQEVDAFLVPSRAARRSHMENGFPADIEVFHYFYEQAEISDQVSLLKNSPTLQTERFFLFVGRLEKLKGVQVLLNTFQEYKDADLVIVGTGTYQRELVALAQGASNIHFLGFLPYQEIMHLYRDAVATLVSSIGYETFGLAILESMVHRTPVIAHDFGPSPELLTDGGGFLYRTETELIEAMKLLIAQPDLREETGARGYQNYIENFSAGEHIQRYRLLVENLMKEKAR